MCGCGLRFFVVVGVALGGVCNVAKVLLVGGVWYLAGVMGRV